MELAASSPFMVIAKFEDRSRGLFRGRRKLILMYVKLAIVAP